ncbi:MAG: SDR family NAD(P)-dependent oxidoreductase [Acidobacteria bacterium]|nr:SDR family NAD(P)-dependent oxidoreductase [Acidobacteriota bacterium]
MSENEAGLHGAGIAIVGMAGRFPGAPDLAAYWRNLREGIESITVFERDRLLASGVPERLLDEPGYVRARGVLEGADQFDAAFFGYSPREATIMDPQQRIFLECSWQALESAGYDPKAYRGLIGVYGGATSSSYLPLVYSDPSVLAQTDPLSIAIGNEIAFLTTRVSYKLDLRGPSCPVQTACSTSLVAIHLACQGLLNAECDLALAGGASVRLPQECGYLYQPAGILSPDGHCRPFDADAQGTLFSNGAGVVVLKRLDEAIADGDFIYAVIRGSAINNDGSQKASFTAPAVGGQREVIADALTHADVEPETVSYVETHGTATSLGDSIEMQALKHVFPADRMRQYCALGSVKSNIGHLDAAAGVAAFIKATLALHHREIPPSLHYTRPNPDIDFANSAFVVNTRLAEWKRRDGVPRRAGVSSFGFGGTNAHVILEEAPEPAASGPSRRWQLLTLSAETGDGLDQATAALGAHLRARGHESLPDAAFTLNTGRRPFRQRRILVCGDAAEGARALETLDPSATFTGAADGGLRPVIFMFPGQGAQHVGMAADLYQEEPVFREIVDRCASILLEPIGLDLRTLLYPAASDAAAADRLRRTRYAQPALFVVEYALARLFMSWGVRPESCIGHSIGELVAACLADVMSLDDALRLVALRGELMERMPEGAMTAVPLPEDRVRRMLTPSLWLSVVNAPDLCVVSGASGAIDQFEQRLRQDGIQAQRLQTSHAFHSGMMEGAVRPFVEAVSRIRLQEPRLPYISNVTGRWIERAQACDPEYWGRQLREPVLFAAGVAELLKGEPRLFLEIGPSQTLVTLVRQQAAGRVQQVASLPHARQADALSSSRHAITALGRLWLGGADVEWAALYRDQSRRRLPLPTYPFQRQRFWVNPRPRTAQPSSREERSTSKISSIDRWFHTPSWTRTPRPAANLAAHAPTTWLIFKDAQGLGDAVLAALRAAGQRAVEVVAGRAFEARGDGRFSIDPASPGAYKELVDEVADPASPLAVLHLWSLDGGDPQASVASAFAAERALGFDSLLHLAQALEGTAAPSVRIGVVTCGAQEVTGDEPLSPGAAVALGLCRVIPQECPGITCKSIDLGEPQARLHRGGARTAGWLVSELLAEDGDRMIAYRGDHRWVLRFAPLPLPPAAGRPPLLTPGGVYLITGGLGDIGLNMAEYLARTCGARLVLTGRSPLPAREQWDAWCAAHPAADPASARIRRIRAVEASGGQVLVVGADASRRDEMEAAFDQAEARFGPVNGVIHAAGLVVGDAFRPLAETDEDVCARQFAPKIAGLCVLDEVVRARGVAPDFIVLVSSLSSILGGLRFAAYASANAFIDAFAYWRNRTATTRWLTVNWDSWMRAEDEARLGAAAAATTDLVMRGSEGIEAFHRLLAADAGTQIVVSAGDLQARIDQWIGLAAMRGAPRESAPEAAARHPRPNLQTEYRAPADDLERSLAAIWQELLGIDRVGTNDSFFELGGDSLLGIQVIARIKKLLAASVSPVSLYEGPTVALLADVIRNSGAAAQLDGSRSRGDRRREARTLRQLQAAG